jgi:photosystem II stability/assembly factor-like uncharacterized protein
VPNAPGREATDPLTCEAFRSDAQLHDVAFVNLDCGWAVGDRGVIWATTDGGRHWQLQQSGVSCPLYSVSFLDPQTGWAAGGATQPFVHLGDGVLLATHDGGKTWSQNLKVQLPILRQVRFFDPRHGWAVGCSSAMYPSGVFTTETGGRNWQPYPAGTSPGWRAGSFFDTHTGIAVGPSSAMALVRHGELDRLPGTPFGLRSLNAVALVPPQYGWLVGDGALVAMTDDLGVNWHAPPGPLPPDLPPQYDFAALCVRGPKAWIAGTPGTRVFHSPDAGHTWIAWNTGQPLPISALQMVDDQHGWAVGALGSILATADGGQTWQRQRAGGARAAILAIFSEPAKVPLELLARLCGNEGYLGVVETVGRRDVEVTPRTAVPLADRFREAVLAVGGSGARIAWQFPLRQPGLGLSRAQVVTGWDLALDGHGLPALQAYLVRQIRLWRPEIIVAEQPQAEADPVAQLVGRAVAEAVPLAADPKAFVALAGLEPWRVKKLFGVLPPGLHGAPDLPTAQLAPRLGRALVDVADVGRSLLTERVTPAPATIGFHQEDGVLGEDAGREDFFHGIAQPVGGETRRGVLDTPADSLDMLTKIAQRRRNMLAILDKSAQDPLLGRQLLAQTDEFARQLDPDGAAWILYHLAERYHASGQAELAAETYQAVAEQYPQHPLRRAALTWLIQYYASSEAAWRVRGQQRYRTAKGSTLAIDPARQEDRLARAAALGNLVEQSDPALFAEPRLRFPLAVAQRSQNGGKQAERFYTQCSHSANRDTWCACAQAECWLAERKGPAIKPVLHAVPASVRPHLDGRLDDPVWQQAPPAALRSVQGDDAQWPAQIQVAFDAQFLYLAIVCRQAPQAKYEPAAPSARNADLSGQDRVDIFLDLDRSYVTAYRLTVDYHGWKSASCCGDATWNPGWYVAARMAEGSWTIEAAIPLEELTGHYPAAHDVWAIGVQRTVPGVGFQSWSTPASTEGIPEGFGLLMFE